MRRFIQRRMSFYGKSVVIWPHVALTRVRGSWPRADGVSLRQLVLVLLPPLLEAWGWALLRMLALALLPPLHLAYSFRAGWFFGTLTVCSLAAS